MGGGRCQKQGQSADGSFCSIPNPPLTQHRLLAETLPQVCGTCCWGRGDRGQIREVIRVFRISQKGRQRERALPVVLAVWVRQARTWGPLPECLHLDKRPSEQHNTKKLQVTKNHNAYAPLGQKDTRSHKQTTFLRCWEHKQGGVPDPPTVPSRGTDHLNDASCLPHRPAPVVTPFQDGSSSSRGAGEGTCFLFLLPCAAVSAPIKPCLEFSSGLLSVSRVQGPWRDGGW